MQNDDNVLDLLEDNEEMLEIEYLNDKTMMKIFIIFGIVVLIICISFIMFGFIGKNDVPIANKDIYSRTKVTEDMITIKSVPRYKLLKNNLIQNEYMIIGKYVILNEVIKKDSYFYEELLTTEKELAKPEQIEDDFILYQMAISLENYGENNVNKNDRVNIYFEFVSNNERKVGQLITDIRVIDITDKNGLSIFELSDEKRVPAFIMLEVKKEDYSLLNKYSYMGIKLFYSTKEIKTNVTKDDLDIYLNSDNVSLFN